MLQKAHLFSDNRRNEIFIIFKLEKPLNNNKNCNCQGHLIKLFIQRRCNRLLRLDNNEKKISTQVVLFASHLELRNIHRCRQKQVD